MHPSFYSEFVKNCNGGDTTLRLNAFAYVSNEASMFGSSEMSAGGQGTYINNPDDGCKLVLGLGPTPSSYSDSYSLPKDDSTKDLAPVYTSGHDSMLKLGLSGSADVVSDALNVQASVQLGDEGSTSCKKSGGYMRSLVMAPRVEDANRLLTKNKTTEVGAKSTFHLTRPSSEPSPSSFSDRSMSAVSEPRSASESSHQRAVNSRRCKFDGCIKGARGTTGLCIGHGGGHRCQKPGCNKGAESRTAFCKAHGGGRRCHQLGCTKSAEGKTDHCIAHGGGRRCGFSGGCTKAARGKSGLCIRHGGGKRCKVESCIRSAEGQTGLCISHGGGRRCQVTGCTKGAQGSTMFCKAHGGGKRCIFAGCTKGAEGSTPLCKGHGGGKRCLFDGGGICPKSVHGGTSFCVAHGGGKRCSVPGCTKSARGRTDCCVKHGGGKRCKVENCGKSAQGSTDFCKAHGGGKRCNWGEGKCEKFARGKSGLCAAHCTLVRGREASRGGMIGAGLFHGLVSLDKARSSSGGSVITDSTNSVERAAKRQKLIPPQVLVPLSMKASTLQRSAGAGEDAPTSFGFAGPEGRVHGGGLLSLLGGDLNSAITGI
ncbi:loricrin-like [Salvia hispanica]|uniref:loricrin-like n=1 Tax=Salvia hispanica TaxID=49212 RepID=UPI0020096380|nr:loricrin-like [Salvia hispanica]XP_047983682.1 loricrin-like [Salvia hispanica]XP_047983683.1 loricrin-like [Salvia hispanica]